MSPDGDFHPAPTEFDVRVMVLIFCQFPDPIGEIKCIPKVFQFVFFLQMMFLNQLPISTQLVMEGIELGTFQRRHASFARNALFGS